MTRTKLWQSIAGTLQQEIAAGHYRAGDKLPTEAALAARFGVNRHTVRRAIADLVERGIVRTRRGSGAFVRSEPTDYPIGRRVRFHQNIRATGRLPQKNVLRLETRPCDTTEAKALALDEGEAVIVYEGLSLSGGTPIAHFVSVFPQHRAPGLMETLTDVSSVTEALKRNGIADYVRTETRITAERATTTQALHLGLREGDPVLIAIGTNATLDGQTIELGTTCFAGDRVALVVAND